MTHALLALAIVAGFAIILGAARADRHTNNIACPNSTTVNTPFTMQSRLPRLSRNRWNRQDLNRTLMSDDDYVGRISDRR